MLFPNLFIDVLCYNIKSENGEGIKVDSLSQAYGVEVVEAIKNSGFTVLEEISDITKEEFKKKTGLESDVIDSIYNEVKTKINK